MAGWIRNELAKIGKAEELEIATVRRDGTLRDPVTIWVVRVGDDLFVRSVKGREGPWFRGAQGRHQAHIEAGGVEKDVRLVETKEAGDEIDAAYRKKYRDYSVKIVNTVLTTEARAATLKLLPR